MPFLDDYFGIGGFPSLAPTSGSSEDYFGASGDWGVEFGIGEFDELNKAQTILLTQGETDTNEVIEGAKTQSILLENTQDDNAIYNELYMWTEIDQ